MHAEIINVNEGPAKGTSHVRLTIDANIIGWIMPVHYNFDQTNLTGTNTKYIAAKVQDGMTKNTVTDYLTPAIEFIFNLDKSKQEAALHIIREALLSDKEIAGFLELQP